MDTWWIFLISAFLFWGLDRWLGLAYVFSGLALLFAIFGLVSATGLNILEYDMLVELLVIFIYTPIFVRLFLVLRAQSASGGPPDVGSQELLEPRDRHALTVYKGVLIAGSLVPLFVFHFITAGLVLATIAALAGWIEVNKLFPLTVIGFPYVTGYVAKTRGVTGVKQILCATGGLILAAAYGALVAFAITLLHPHL